MPDKINRMNTLILPDDPPVRVMSSYHISVERHSHDFYELVYVTEGFCLHDAYGEVTLLMEGDIFILKPGVAHRYIGNRVTRIFNCIFREDALERQIEALSRLPGMDRLFSADLTERIPRIHLSLNERKSIQRQLIAMMEEGEEKPSGWDIRLGNMLACLLIDCARAYEARVDTANENQVYSGYVTQALNYVNLKYADAELSVREIAAQAGVSGDYLSRQFKQVTGIAAQEYLKRYRLARAMALLQAGRPVGEVAKAVGFRNLCHFSREFKKEMGVTPSQYRNQNE